VLARLPANQVELEMIFAQVFRKVCEREHIPSGYRTEACRERLLQDLRRLIRGPDWRVAGEIRTEQQFQYALDGNLEISGRIDRLDVTPDGRAMVIDYKYSSKQNTQKKIERSLQPALYTLAVERVFGLQPAGMWFWGLRGEVVRKACSIDPERLKATIQIVEEIRAGRLAPQPADLEKCAHCDYRDVCRFETQGAALAEGA